LRRHFNFTAFDLLRERGLDRLEFLLEGFGVVPSLS
jgi:hypothetical protein